MRSVIQFSCLFIKTTNVSKKNNNSKIALKNLAIMDFFDFEVGIASFIPTKMDNLFATSKTS